MCAARLIICKNAAVFTYHFLLQRNAGILTLGVRFILQSYYVSVVKVYALPMLINTTHTLLENLNLDFHPVQKDFGKSLPGSK